MVELVIIPVVLMQARIIVHMQAMRGLAPWPVQRISEPDGSLKALRPLVLPGF